MTEPADKETIQAAIDDAIAAAGGKQSLLAEKLGCRQQTVSKLRSGEIPMTADWALKISAAVGGAVTAGRFVPALAQIAGSNASFDRVPA